MEWKAKKIQAYVNVAMRKLLRYERHEKLGKLSEKCTG